MPRAVNGCGAFITLDNYLSNSKRKIKMTYREELQNMIRDLQNVYDKANYLRDLSTEEEKIVLNELRRVLPDVWSPMQKLDNSISDARGSYEIY